MINNNLESINDGYNFSDVTKTISEYKKANPLKEVISLGIGDVSKPIVKEVIEAMHEAVDDLSSMDKFQGYGLYYGLEELRKTIALNDYKDLDIGYEEIYISDGAKSDCGNILELFNQESLILLSSPLYPIYENTCKCLSKKYEIQKVNENYKLDVPNKRYDIIYLCTPNNPIGNAYTKEELKAFVDYANKNHSYLIIDNVYEAFVENKDVPKSIYEIEGAKTCAIEIRSYSKIASFTGARCSYYVLPKEMGLAKLWNERCINRFNGASYIAQKGAIASYSEKAKETIKENIKAYKENAKYLKDSLIDLGFEVIGGEDSPYLWIKAKDNMTGIEYFEFLLKELQIIMIPGEVFGDDKHLRVSSLGLIENSKKAVERLRNHYEK